MRRCKKYRQFPTGSAGESPQENSSPAVGCWNWFDQPVATIGPINASSEHYVGTMKIIRRLSLGIAVPYAIVIVCLAAAGRSWRRSQNHVLTMWVQRKEGRGSPLPEQQLRILSDGKPCFLFEIWPKFVDNRPPQRHRSRTTSHPS